MDGARRMRQVRGVLHIAEVAAELFRGDNVSVCVQVPGGEPEVCFTVFDMLQYQASRHSLHFLLIGLRFGHREAYFDEIELPLSAPEDICALFTDDQMTLHAADWTTTILNLSKMLPGDQPVVLAGAGAGSAPWTSSSR